MIYGFGIYDGTFVGKNNENRIYQVWVGMIKRCYSTRHQSTNPSYIGTTVSDDWKLYSNFERWYNENYIEGFFLDKDIIGGSKKLYSPETCAFVPREINNCITESNSSSSEYSLGVCYHKKKKSMMNEYKKPFYSQINNTSLGSFETQEEAHLAWQLAKRDSLTSLIEKYKDIVNQDVINGLQKRIDILTNDINNNLITVTLNKI